ncbi:MAG TPA: amino acid racemase [Steroidobacteraceae bacterium]|nr:amino acid racemase [Steroidobacteraceae bacterium]
MQHIGIVAGSSEGAALCYRTICLEAPLVLGEYRHPPVTLDGSVDLGTYMSCIYRDEWSGVGALMLDSVRRLQAAGAQFVICPDNTFHQGLPYVRDASPLPWLHIAEVVAQQAHSLGLRHLGVLGTRYLMEGPVYREVLESSDIRSSVPGAEERGTINRIIFEELVNGRVLASSRAQLLEVIERLRGLGCDAIVLGCTELPLIIEPQDSPLPTLDSTRLLARAALRRAIGSATS